MGLPKDRWERGGWAYMQLDRQLSLASRHQVEGHALGGSYHQEIVRRTSGNLSGLVDIIAACIEQNAN